MLNKLKGHTFFFASTGSGISTVIYDDFFKKLNTNSKIVYLSAFKDYSRLEEIQKIIKEKNLQSKFTLIETKEVKNKIILINKKNNIKCNLSFNCDKKEIKKCVYKLKIDTNIVYIHTLNFISKNYKKTNKIFGKLLENVILQDNFINNDKSTKVIYHDETHKWFNTKNCKELNNKLKLFKNKNINLILLSQEIYNEKCQYIDNYLILKVNFDENKIKSKLLLDNLIFLKQLKIQDKLIIQKILLLLLKINISNIS